MEKSNFWNDAARYGAIIALAAIVFDVLGFYVQNSLLSLLSLVVFVLLLTWAMKRRVAEYGATERGYSYGRCLGFMVCVMLCAGFIEGAFMGVAANWLFVAKYDAMMSQSVGVLESTGFYTGDQLALIMKWMRSPLWLIFGGMLGLAVKGGFFGLFIAAFTKRDIVWVHIVNKEEKNSEEKEHGDKLDE